MLLKAKFFCGTKLLEFVKALNKTGAIINIFVCVNTSTEGVLTQDLRSISGAMIMMLSFLK